LNGIMFRPRGVGTFFHPVIYAAVLFPSLAYPKEHSYHPTISAKSMHYLLIIGIK
jgi:hypothetical protein